MTLPSDKLSALCKALPANAQINLTATDNNRCLITSDKSKFTLGTLPAGDYPSIGEPDNITPLTINRRKMSEMISKTQFAMAIQDVRYYLTGMLFEVSQRLLTIVATDGHRLALSKCAIEVADDLNMQAILPRKAVVELERLLNELGKLLGDKDNPVTLKFGREFCKLSCLLVMLTAQAILMIVYKLLLRLV